MQIILKQHGKSDSFHFQEFACTGPEPKATIQSDQVCKVLRKMDCIIHLISLRTPGVAKLELEIWVG